MDFLDLKKIRIIELICPFSQFDSPQSMAIFSKVLTMRKRGYHSRHQQSALPVDTYDFIGSHYLVTAEHEGDLKVLGGFRMVSLNESKHFNLAFPLRNLLASANATSHLKALDDRLSAKENKDAEFTYVSSWTNEPSARKDPGFSELMLNLTTTMNVFSKVDHPNHYRFACGVLRLKTEKYIQWLGYKTLKNGEEELGEVHQANLNGEPVVLHELSGTHSPEALAIAKTYEIFWRNRLQLRFEDSLDLAKQTAA